MPIGENDLKIYIQKPDTSVSVFTDLAVAKTLDYAYGLKPEIANTIPYETLMDTTALEYSKQQKFLFEYGCKISSSIFSVLDGKATEPFLGPLQWTCNTITDFIQEDINKLVAGKLYFATQHLDEAKFNSLLSSTTADVFFSQIEQDTEQLLGGDFLKSLENYSPELVNDFKNKTQNKLVLEGIKTILRQNRENKDVTDFALSKILKRVDENSDSLQKIKTLIKGSIEEQRDWAESFKETQDKIANTVNAMSESYKAKTILEFEALSASSKLVWLQCGVMDATLITRDVLGKIQSEAKLEGLVNSFNKGLGYATAFVSLAKAIGISPNIIKPLSTSIEIGRKVSGAASALIKGDYLGAIMGILGCFGFGGPSTDEIILEQLGQMDKKLDTIIKMIEQVQKQLEQIFELNLTILTEINKLSYDVDGIYIDLQTLLQLQLGDQLSELGMIDGIYEKLEQEYSKLGNKAVSDNELAYFLHSILMKQEPGMALYGNISSGEQLNEILKKWRVNNQTDIISGSDIKQIYTIDTLKEAEAKDEKYRLRDLRDFYKWALTLLKTNWGVTNDKDKLVSDRFNGYVADTPMIADINTPFSRNIIRKDFSQYQFSITKRLLNPNTIKDHGRWLLRSHLLISNCIIGPEGPIALNPLDENHLKQLRDNTGLIKRILVDEIMAVELTIMQFKLLSGYQLADKIDAAVITGNSNTDENQMAISLFGKNRIFAYNYLSKYLHDVIKSPAAYNFLIKIDGSKKMEFNFFSNETKINIANLKYFKTIEEYDTFYKECAGKKIDVTQFYGIGWYVCFSGASPQSKNTVARKLLLKLPSYEEFREGKVLLFPTVNDLYKLREELLNVYYIYSGRLLEEENTLEKRSELLKTLSIMNYDARIKESPTRPRL